MRALLPSFTGKYVAHLVQRTVPDTVHPFYLKWLRYYLDFCEKYQFFKSDGVGPGQHIGCMKQSALDVAFFELKPIISI
jgi:hypothetical protein